MQLASSNSCHFAISFTCQTSFIIMISIIIAWSSWKSWPSITFIVI